MAVLTADGFRHYASKDEVAFGWPLSSYVAPNTALVDISGRRALDLNGARLARAFAARRRVCAHFVIDMSTGTLGSSTTLWLMGLNPVGVASGAYMLGQNARFQVRAVGANLQILRRAFSSDGTLQTTMQTVATVAHGMTAGNTYRVEILADVTGETGECQVMINGVQLGAWTFARTIGAYANDADWGSLVIEGESTSGARGRISNLVVYDDAAPTAWPAGALNITYMAAQANAGETISWPPLTTDPPISIDSAAGKTWSLTDSGVAAGTVKGVVGTIRLATPDAVTPAKAQVSWKNGGTVLKSDQLTVQPGVTTFDHHALIPVTDPAVLDAMTLEVKPW